METPLSSDRAVLEEGRSLVEVGGQKTKIILFNITGWCSLLASAALIVHFKTAFGFAGHRRAEGSWGRRANGEEEQLLTQELPPGLPPGGGNQNENQCIDPSALVFSNRLAQNQRKKIWPTGFLLVWRRKWPSHAGTSTAAGPTPGRHGASPPTPPCSGSCCWTKTTATCQPAKRWAARHHSFTPGMNDYSEKCSAFSTLF